MTTLNRHQRPDLSARILQVAWWYPSAILESALVTRREIVSEGVLVVVGPRKIGGRAIADIVKNKNANTPINFNQLALPTAVAIQKL
jgi:hypothetical protein